MTFILEVQKFNSDGKNEHVGYMDKVFNSKSEARDYYDKYNSHMLSLNAYNNWRSEMDPNTNLLYVVREHLNEYLKITPFENE
jgi:hypothetical protein